MFNHRSSLVLAGLLAISTAPTQAAASDTETSDTVASDTVASDTETWIHTGIDRFYMAGALTRSQGVAYDQSSDSLVFSWQYGLQRTTLDYSTLKAEPLAIPAEILAQGGDHIGGIDCYEGLIYAPIEDGDDYLHPYVVLFNAQTLGFTGTTYLLPHDLQTEGVPWIAIDAARGVFYTAEWSPIYVINRFSLEDFSEQGQLTLDTTLKRIQGAKVYHGALYAASDNDDKSIYRIDLDNGHVSELLRILELPGVFAQDPFLETEDLAFYDDGSGSDMHVILIQSVFPKQEESQPPLAVMPSSSLYHFARVETKRAHPPRH